MTTKACGLFTRRDPRDHDRIGAQVLDRCKRVSETIVQAPDLHNVARASLTIFTQWREVAREILQAKIAREAQQLTRQEGLPGGPEAGVTDIHTRTVSPEPVCGEVRIPVRTFQCRGGGATVRPEDTARGVPKAGDVPDDVRELSAPVVAERPHRVANDRFARGTGGALSSRGAQGIMDRTAADLSAWQAERARQAAVEDAWAMGDGAADVRVESARAGGMAPIDGRWSEPTGAPILVRRLEPQAEAPTRGAVLRPPLCERPGRGGGGGRPHATGHPRGRLGAHPWGGDPGRWRPLDVDRGGCLRSRGTSDTG